MGLPRREPRGPLSHEKVFERLLHPLTRLLSAIRVGPNALTTTGWALSLGAGTLFGLGHVRMAGAVMLFGGLFDALDGAVARESDRMSDFGAFLDSTLDRFSESAVFAGVVFFYATAGHPLGALLAAAAMTFSLLTSYTRARAEGLGYECEVGLLERAGRVVILSLCSLAGLLTVGLLAITAGALITTVQRTVHVRRATEK